jgi:fatty aldehyde-generating acyl-ACP reductase
VSDAKPFAFIIHPIDAKGDVARKYPMLGKLPESVIDFACAFWPPVYISQIEGVRSRTGRETMGHFIACPYTTKRMTQLPEKEVYRKIIQTGRLAEKLGAQMLGLGAYTSVVGDAGITIAKALDIPVTTGDAYTISIATQAVVEAGRLMNIDIHKATAAVVGATGAIGSVVAQLLAHQVSKLILIGRREEALNVVREKCEGGSAQLVVSTDVNDMKEAELIVTVTSAIGAIVHPEHLKPGAVVCDVARPRDVSRTVFEKRDDVLVIEGGMVDVPGPVNFNFNFGFPPGKAYACMAETMALALDGWETDYTLGRDIELSRVHEIEQIAYKHGFRMSGLRSFEREVTPEHIAGVQERAHSARRTWQPAPA